MGGFTLDFTRQLERELTAAREEINILKSKYADHHVEAERITSEIKTVTEQRDGLRSGIDYASDQLSKVTEQRDRLAEALRECREDSVELLGERDWWQNEPRLNYGKHYQATRDNVTRADEALQSLTPNSIGEARADNAAPLPPTTL